MAEQTVGASGRRPTRDDVALLAGVSSAVVSYTLNGGPRPVAESTKKRVMDAVSELNYVPNEIARSLAGQSTRSVGFIAPTLANPAWADMATGVSDVLSAASYLLMVCAVDDAAFPEERHAEMLAAKRADGVVLVSTGDTGSTLGVLERAGIPTVVVEQDVASVPCVVFDAEAIGRLVTEHLLSLGHTRIAMLREHRSSLDSWKRYLGYEKALNAAGLEVDPRLVADVTSNVNHRIVAASLEPAAWLLDADPAPTAVFAHNDLMAIAVLHEARRRGWDVPRDLSVAGADDLEPGRYTDPPITTVSTEKQELGRLAARKLLELVDGMVPERLTILPPSELIVRGSTSRPPS